MLVAQTSGCGKCGNFTPGSVDLLHLRRPHFVANIVLGTGYKHNRALSWLSQGPQASGEQVRPFVKK